MTIQRLLEAVLRISKAAGSQIGNAAISVHDSHYAETQTRGSVAGVFFRTASVSVFGPKKGGGGGREWIDIGDVEVDMNDIVLKIDYDRDAPWWAVNPFIDALAGK